MKYIWIKLICTCVEDKHGNGYISIIEQEANLFEVYTKSRIDFVFLKKCLKTGALLKIIADL